MKYKLMSLGLGIALSLGILLFMATLVEPPQGEKVASEQKPIVINMQNEVTEVQVREHPVPQEPEPLPEPPAALASTPLPMPAAAPLAAVEPSLDLVSSLSAVQVYAPGVATSTAPVLSGNYHGQQQGAGIGAGDMLMPLQRIEPVYPYRAQQSGIEGFVTLRFSVNAEGGVQDVEVVEAKPNRQFERAAIQAINKWRYQPRPGATDKLVQVITLKFKLES
ncbi:energy transducer TonB [Aeromonas veronii]|uniref:energy transducer TonB n=1 Tax=Aeromonas veronii TaxID=654 RepID=UPI00191CFCE3|nr:energy transducer TonB [Aeromonas veronii]MBL0475574.1 TonB family protein [Aeromonas veronii]MCX0440935.1 TonB family protein [Aeromonas veronii]